MGHGASIYCEDSVYVAADKETRRDGDKEKNSILAFPFFLGTEHRAQGTEHRAQGTGLRAQGLKEFLISNFYGYVTRPYFPSIIPNSNKGIGSEAGSRPLFRGSMKELWAQPVKL